MAISIAVTCSVALLTACAIWLFSERGRRFLRRNFEIRATVPHTRPESPSAIVNKMPQVLLVYDFNDEIVSAKVSLLRNKLTECGAPQVKCYNLNPRQYLHFPFKIRSTTTAMRLNLIHEPLKEPIGSPIEL